MAAGNAGRPVAGRDRVSQPEPDLDGLAGKVGHNFGHPDILRRAVTHASAEPRAWNAYERLEFLGDRVLALVVAEQLLDRFPHEREGALRSVESRVGNEWVSTCRSWWLPYQQKK